MSHTTDYQTFVKEVHRLTPAFLHAISTLNATTPNIEALKAPKTDPTTLSEWHTQTNSKRRKNPCPTQDAKDFIAWSTRYNSIHPYYDNIRFIALHMTGDENNATTTCLAHRRFVRKVASYYDEVISMNPADFSKRWKASTKVASKEMHRITYISVHNSLVEKFEPVKRKLREGMVRDTPSIAFTMEMADTAPPRKGDIQAYAEGWATFYCNRNTYKALAGLLARLLTYKGYTLDEATPIAERKVKQSPPPLPQTYGEWLEVNPNTLSDALMNAVIDMKHEV